MIETAASFLVFCILQAMFINGVKEAFSEGNILYGLNRWLTENIKKDWILKPLFKCVRCMASWHGAITFFPTAIYLFGFQWVQLPIYVFNVGILCYLNYWFYKRQ